MNPKNGHTMFSTENAGIVKTYEAVTNTVALVLLKQVKQWDYFLW